MHFIVILNYNLLWLNVSNKADDLLIEILLDYKIRVLFYSEIRTYSTLQQKALFVFFSFICTIKCFGIL